MPVNTPHPDYKKMLPKWERCRDVCAGQDAVHDAGSKYLPMLKDQQSGDYVKYVQRAGFYNATWRTIAGLVGMIFRKPPKIDAPEEFVGVQADEDKEAPGKPGIFDDVDGCGQPLQLFMQKVSEEALKQGRLGVLVDYPPAAPNLTEADAIRMNLRPTMAIYDTFSVINWKTAKVNNKTMLVQVVLHETKEVTVDEFTSNEEDRWRVLDLIGLNPADPGDLSGVQYRQRLFKLDTQKRAKAKKTSNAGASLSKEQAVAVVQDGPDIFPMMNGKNLTYIPFQIISTDDMSTDVDDPPLIDLVDVNLSHYRTTASLEHGCHFTALPTLVLTGWKKQNPNDKVYLGSEAALVTTNDQAKASFVEFTGQGLSALEKNLDRKEKQMAVLGARMLEPQIRGVESAEVASIHRVGEQSMLSSVSMAISLGMTTVVKWFVEWGKGDPNAVKIELNRDFYPVPMTPQMLMALIAGWQQGVPGLSDQGLFDQLKQGEIVAEDVTLEQEQARIESRSLELAKQQQDLFPNDGSTDPAGTGNTPPTAGAPTGDTGQQIHIHLPAAKSGGTRKITKGTDGSYKVEDTVDN